MFSSDGNVGERIEIAKKIANRIFHGKVESYEEFILMLCWNISEYRNIPLYSDYYKNKTLEQLIMETEMIRLSKRTPEDAAKDAVVDNKEEIDHLFDDIIAANNKWVDVPKSPSVISDSEIDEFDRKFFSTGKFQGEE